jgi:hypothetical protein
VESEATIKRVKPAYDTFPVNASLILFAERAGFAAAVSRHFALLVVISRVSSTGVA